MLRAFVLLAAAACATPAQDTRLAKSPEAVVEHLLGPSPTLRKQALAWAREHLAEVAAPLARALEEKPAGAVSFDAIRSLGELKDPRVSAALLTVAERPEFPWKPHAVEALADQAFPGAAGLFARSTSSPVARSRAAACRGIGVLGIREMDSLLSKCLGDEEAAVRLEAARALLGFGNPSGVQVVIKDLSLDRRFTDADHGAVAREAAAAFLREALSLPADQIPAEVASQARLDGVLAAARAKLGASAGLPDAIAPHEGDVPDSFRYAVEARSCLEGDWYVRFDDAGNVVFGRDLMRRYKVDPKVLAPIKDALVGMDTGPRNRRILGPITCDFERFGIRENGAWRTLVIGTGKRDAAFDAMEEAMADLIGQTRGPQWAEAHRRRIAPFQAARPATDSAASRSAR